MAFRTSDRTNPLDGIERLLVDGSNLLHALRRGAPAAPAATLIGRLRGVIEMPVRIELLFDGPPDPGMRDVRIASGVTVRHSGRLSADALLVRMAAEAIDPGTLLVVTDDGDLRRELNHRGARTISTRWLIARLEHSRLESPSIGRPKPSAARIAADGTRQAARADPDADDANAPPGWNPGRGATSKHGNPRRLPKSERPGGRR
jgi:hypothetical protein